MVSIKVSGLPLRSLIRNRMTFLQHTCSVKIASMTQVITILVMVCVLACSAENIESSIQSNKYFSARQIGRLQDFNKLHPPTNREFTHVPGSSRAKTLQRILSQRRRSPLREAGLAVPSLDRFTYSSDSLQTDHRSAKSTSPGNPQQNAGEETQFSDRRGRIAADDGEGLYRGIYDDMDEGRSFALGSMIEQLSSALHRTLVRNRSPAAMVTEQGRRQAASAKQLNRNSNRVAGGGLGGGNEYYPNSPQKANGLPECATQQVCNAVYVRLNMTQPLCSCPTLTAACSASVSPDDKHTIELKMGRSSSKAVTLIKTCEPVWSVRDCRAPRDWSILALQNTRTGKAHYLVICKCPEGSKLDGPLNHDQPSYAQVPGIRVYGMMCVSTSLRAGRYVRETPSFPWARAVAALDDPSVVDDLLSDEEDAAPVVDLLHLEGVA